MILNSSQLCLEASVLQKIKLTELYVFQYFWNFRDAAYGSCNFYITLLDCFHAVKKVSDSWDAPSVELENYSPRKARPSSIKIFQDVYDVRDTPFPH